MKSGRLRLVWVMPFVVGLLIVGFMLLSPLLISGAIEKFHVKTRAVEAIERLTGGEASIGRVSAALFPVPHMVVSQGYAAIPGKLQVRVKKVDIYPRMLYLLQGKLLLSSLTIEGAQAQVVIAKGHGSSRPARLKSLKIPTLWFALPPLKSLSLKGCKVALLTATGTKPFLVLSPLNLKASLRHNRLKLKLRVRTNHQEELTADGRGDLLLNQAHAHLLVSNLQPHLWIRQLGISPPEEFRKGILNLDLTVEKRGKTISVQGTTSIPSLTFKTRETPKAVTVSLPKAAGEWKMDEGGWTLKVGELRLKYPPAEVSITASKQRRGGRRHASIVMHAYRLDLGALRRWLKQVPPVYHHLHNLFDIVHSGTARDLTVGFSGERFSEISHIERLTIDGKVENALVMIPEVKLPVREVSGSLHMENATLTGKGIEGRFLSSTRVTGCRFSLLTLKVKNQMRPFHIQLDAHGNDTMADLLPVLKRVIHEKGILQELGRMKVQGSARLHLYLGEYLKDLHPRAELSNIEGRVDYGAIPFPVELHGGEGGFYNSTIWWRGISATVDKIKVKTISGALSPLHGNPNLQVNELRATLDMGQLLYWLNHYPVLKPYTSIFPTAKGMVEVEDGTLKGPLLHPHRWRFTLVTRPRVFSFGFALLPFPVTLDGGHLTLTRRRLSLKGVLASGGDSKMLLSGWVNDYMGMPTGASLSYSGTMGEALYLFLARLSHDPQGLWLNTPFQTEGQWDWRGGEAHHLKGKAHWPTGAVATIDMSTSSKGILVRQASIASQGEKFEASTRFPFAPKGRLEVSFNGRVKYGDIESIFRNHGLLTQGGFVKGEGFHAVLDLGRPKGSSFKGTLTAKNLQIDGYFIHWLEARGTSTGLVVKRARFNYGGGDWNATAAITLSQPLHLTGMVEGPLLRLPATGVTQERGKKRERPTGNETRTTQGKTWIRYLESLEGTLSLKIGRVEYGNYTVKGFAGSLGILGEGAGVEVHMRKGNLCSIPLTGKVKIPLENHGQSTYLVHIPRRKLPEENQPRFEKVLPCIFPSLQDKEPLIEGPFRVWGEIKTRDPGDGEPLKHLRGYINVRSNPRKRPGLIHKFKLVSKLLDVLNPLALASNLPKLTMKGIPYNKLMLKISFNEETWPIDQAVLDGPALKIVAKGKLKNSGDEIDATVLVGMLKTVNRVVKNIPLVSTIVKHVLSGKHGSIISIPVSVKGPMDDPLVVPMSPTAVGSELLGIVTRTLKLPVTLLSPLFNGPGKDEKGNRTEQ